MEEQLAQIANALDELRKMTLDMSERLQLVEQANAERIETAKLEGFEKSFERADALQQSLLGGKGRSRRSSMDGKSHAQDLHEEMEELRSGTPPVPVTPEMMKSFQYGFKAALLTASIHTGKEEDHDVWTKDLVEAFEINEMSEITDDDEKTWYDYSTAKENAEGTVIQEKTMRAMLHATLKKGTAFTEYQDAKGVNKRDARGMFLAARDAYDKQNSTLTRTVLKKRLDDMKWDSESTIDSFYHKFTVVVNLIKRVKGADGKAKPMEVEGQIAAFKKKFTESQKDMSSEQQSWRIAFASADLTCAQTNTELTMKQLKSLISLQLDDGMEVNTGKVLQQKGYNTTRGGYKGGNCFNKGCFEQHAYQDCTKEIVCWKCDKPGHVGPYCPTGRGYQKESEEPKKTKTEEFNKARDEQFKLFEEWQKKSEVKKGKNNQQTEPWEVPDDQPWHVGLAEHVRQLEEQELARKSIVAESRSGQKKGQCKEQRVAADNAFEAAEVARMKMVEEKGPPKEWDDDMQERMALAQFDLRNMKERDPDGEYSVMDFLK